MKNKNKTVEKQYQDCLAILERDGLSTFGIMSNQVWCDDPRRMVFSLSRYKFVSKMLSGFGKVLEVGCADAFGTRIVLQEVDELVAIDIDPIFVQDVNDRMNPNWKFMCHTHDMLLGPVEGKFDAVFSLDVLEHISQKNEKVFIKNIVDSLTEHGVLVIGSPSIQSQVYASPQSKIGHINCKNAIGLKKLLSNYFHNVFIFSMNDEVVHTGFYPMAHYLFALCSDKKDHI